MTPELAFENVSKSLAMNLEMVLTEGQPAALEFLHRMKNLIAKYEMKVMAGEPVRKRRKTRHG